MMSVAQPWQILKSCQYGGECERQKAPPRVRTERREPYKAQVENTEWPWRCVYGNLVLREERERERERERGEKSSEWRAACAASLLLFSLYLYLLPSFLISPRPLTLGFCIFPSKFSSDTPFLGCRKIDSGKMLADC